MKGLQIARVALFGGNSNNGLNAGAFYVNVNNLASNSNWNNGASLSDNYPREINDTLVVS